MQIREILQTDLSSMKEMNGSGDPETFFDAEDNSDNDSADAPAKSGSITTLGNTPPLFHPLPCWEIQTLLETLHARDAVLVHGDCAYQREHHTKMVQRTLA